MKPTLSELIFLGTGTSQGIPVIGSDDPVCLSSNPKDKRFRSSVYINIDQTQILIDCGPDFRLQMLNNNLSKLNAILFTHEHNDHTIGLDDTRPIFFENDMKNIPLYGLKRVLNSIEERFPYAFSEDKYPGAPGFDLHYIEDFETITFPSFEVEAIPVLHGNLPILGYKIGNLAYFTDVSAIPEKSKTHLQNLDVLIINVLRKEPRHFSHLVLDEALNLVAELQPKTTYFTHISYKLGFHEEVQSELPENVYLAYDGLKVLF